MSTLLATRRGKPLYLHFFCRFCAGSASRTTAKAQPLSESKAQLTRVLRPPTGQHSVFVVLDVLLLLHIYDTFKKNIIHYYLPRASAGTHQGNIAMRYTCRSATPPAGFPLSTRRFFFISLTCSFGFFLSVSGVKPQLDPLYPELLHITHPYYFR